MAINIVKPKAPPAPSLPADLAADFALVQERFPKIGEKIALMWGTVGLQKYLSTTIFDERGGRQGFPLPVVTALMHLFEYHTTLVPDAPAGEGQVWEDAK
ncbi:MAG: hypothetical protein Q7U91_04110 [Sideroxyarcus sp.]|nr:hypothetical protein [Sideroxyarcus sp.]